MDKRKARKIREICHWQCGSQRLLVIIQCEDSKFLTHFLSMLGTSQRIEVDRDAASICRVWYLDNFRFDEG